MAYKRFFATLIISFLVMYITMFLNMDKSGDYHTSLTRIYMAMLMVSPMAVLMIVMMKSMYTKKRANRVIIVSSIIIFIATFAALHTQAAVSDSQYMKAMIPHHSSAVMTSKHANIHDPEVRALADSIISSQEREIRQMEAILKRIEKR